MKNFLSRQTKDQYAAILSLAAFLFGLVFLAFFGWVDAGDTPSYISIANAILAGNFYTDSNEIMRPPGYPLFLATLMRLGGENLILAAWVQLGFFAATASLTYLAARQAFGESTARLSGWLVALNPALAYFSVVIETETLIIFLVTGALYWIITGYYHQHRRYFLFAGLALALGLWIKPVGLPIAFAFGGAILFIPKIEKRLQKLTLLLLPLLGVYFGWSAHNYMKFGVREYSPIYGLNLLERTIYLDNSGITSKILNEALAIYQDRKERQVIGAHTDDLYYWWAVIETSRQYRSSLSLPEKNREFFKLAIELIRNNPIDYLRNTIGEFVYIWAGYSPHAEKSRPVFMPESRSIEKNWTFLVLGLMLGLAMLALTLMASIHAALKKKWAALVYIIPSLSIPLLMSMLSVTSYRYRLVVEPLILTLVSYALTKNAITSPGAEDLVFDAPKEQA